MVVWPKLFCTLYLSVKDLDILHAFCFKFYMFIHLFFPLIYSFVVLVGCSLTRKIGVSFSFSKMIKKKKEKKKRVFPSTLPLSISNHLGPFHWIWLINSTTTKQTNE